MKWDALSDSSLNSEKLLRMQNLFYMGDSNMCDRYIIM